MNSAPDILRLAWRLRRGFERFPLQTALELGLAPSITGWRRLREVSLQQATLHCTEFHPAAEVRAPLPANVSTPEDLPAEEGWWGFSFRGALNRQSEATLFGWVEDARALAYRDADGRFWPALLAGPERALRLREIRYRPGHGALLRADRSPRRISKAVWLAERVYDNHAHWLTAHLPKLCLWQEMGAPAPLVLPRLRTPAMEATLALLGIDAADHFAIDANEGPLQVTELGVFSHDRLRPELAQLVRRTFRRFAAGSKPWRRLYISRARSKGRRYLEEEELLPVLYEHGFERVFLEDHDFRGQIALMGEARAVIAPHGAGLANMLFCSPGTLIGEISDCSFPNPNFFALAGALGHRYWLIPGVGVGEGPASRRDISAPVAQAAAVVRAIGAAV